MRVDALIDHHARRLTEICELLEAGDKTVWELAHGVHWDYAGGKFAGFADAQRWFALLEVFAHTEFLRRIEKISCVEKETGWIYHMNH